MFSIPHVRTTLASRGFSVAAPTVWNLLPYGIRDFLYPNFPSSSQNSLLQAGFQLPLAAHPSALDSASGWHCAL